MERQATMRLRRSAVWLFPLHAPKLDYEGRARGKLRFSARALKCHMGRMGLRSGVPPTPALQKLTDLNLKTLTEAGPERGTDSPSDERRGKAEEGSEGG